MTAARGQHGPTHHPVAQAALAAMLEAGMLPPSHRQLCIVGDALPEHLAEVGLALVPAPTPGSHRREAVVDQPIGTDR